MASGRGSAEPLRGLEPSKDEQVCVTVALATEGKSKRASRRREERLRQSFRLPKEREERRAGGESRRRRAGRQREKTRGRRGRGDGGREGGREGGRQGGDSPRSQRAPACVSFGRMRRRCAALRRTYHSIQSSCSSMSAVRKQSRSLLATREACTAQASSSSSPATNTLSPYWLLSASASFCRALARAAPRAACGEAGAPWPSGILARRALSLVPPAPLPSASRPSALARPPTPALRASAPLPSGNPPGPLSAVPHPADPGGPRLFPLPMLAAHVPSPRAARGARPPTPRTWRRPCPLARACSRSRPRAPGPGPPEPLACDNCLPPARGVAWGARESPRASPGEWARVAPRPLRGP